MKNKITGTAEDKIFAARNLIKHLERFQKEEYDHLVSVLKYKDSLEQHLFDYIFNEDDDSIGFEEYLDKWAR